MTIRALSYGGGTQSTALLVLAAQGEIAIDVAIFANVGEDSENPETLRLVRVRRKLKSGMVAPGIRAWVENDERSVNIPARMPNGAPGHRSCTTLYKRIPVARELKRRGATKDRPATILLGISVEEWNRMSTSNIPYIANEYPLVKRFLDRDDCSRVIADAGLPLPPKSSCTFCPFHERDYWTRLVASDPDAFEREAQFEDAINAHRSAIGRDPVYIHPRALPLREAVLISVADTGQVGMFEDGASCDIAGWCQS